MKAVDVAMSPLIGRAPATAWALILAFYAVVASTTELLSLGGVESAHIYIIQRLLLGGSLYPELLSFPFDVTQKTPLFYWVVQGIAQLLDVQGQDYPAIYRIARLTSLLCTVVTGLIIHRTLVRIFHVDPFYAWCSITLITLGLFPWGFLARTDSLYWMFSVASFATHLLFLKERRSWMHAASVGLWCLALLSKQSAVLWAIVIAINVLLFTDWREFTRACLVTLPVIVIFAGVIALLLPVEAVDHLFYALDNGSSRWFAYVKAYKPLFAIFGTNIVIAVPMAVYCCLKGDRALQGLGLAVLLTLFISGVFALKIGSAVHYFIEFSIVSFAIMAILADHISAQFNVALKQFVKISALFIVFVFGIFVFAANDSKLINAIRAKQFVQTSKIGSEIRRLAANQDVWIYSFNFNINLEFPGRSALPQSHIILQSVQTGALDPDPIYKAFESGRVDFAVLHSENWRRIQKGRREGSQGVFDQLFWSKANLLKDFKPVLDVEGYTILKWSKHVR